MLTMDLCILPLWSSPTCVSQYAHHGPVYLSMITTDLCTQYAHYGSIYSPNAHHGPVSSNAHYGPVFSPLLTTDLCIHRCSLWPCVFLYAFYAPAYPTMFTTDLCIPLCLPRSCVFRYAHYGPVYPYAHYGPMYPFRRIGKRKKNLSKNRKRRINNNTLVKHWFPPSFQCLVL
jgi:hypothetical protein